MEVYEKWYGTHKAPTLLKDAVYGLAEIYRNDIKTANLIANAGCYTTCSILTLYPLVKNDLIDVNTIIIDAKSGVSGAGRSVSFGSMFCEANENVKAYKIAEHRHTPEIEQTLSKLSGKDVTITFVPHLLPVNRGIISTCYARLNEGVTKEQIRAAYEEFYKDEFFVRVLPDGANADIHNIKYSNFCDISLHVDERTGTFIAISAIDNMVKGAAGQAIQNMNIIFGLDEKTGLIIVPPAF